MNRFIVVTFFMLVIGLASIRGMGSDNLVNDLKGRDSVRSEAADRIAFKVDTTMAELIKAKGFDFNKVVEIRDDGYMSSIILAHESEIWAYAAEDSFTNIVLLAFTEWCGDFLATKSDFVVFQLPFNILVDKDNHVWTQSIRDGNNFENNGNNISFDPYVDQVSLNKELLGDKIVVAVRKIFTHGTGQVRLNAIIPYKDEYYMHSIIVYFRKTVDFRYFNTKDLNEIREIFTDNISRLIYNDGVISPNLFIRYMHWAYESIGNHKIQKLNIDPETENITIKSLFYDKR